MADGKWKMENGKWKIKLENQNESLVGTNVWAAKGAGGLDPGSSPG